MKLGILVVVVFTNIVALFCAFNPWFQDWSAQGIAFLVAEAIFLSLIGVPVFMHHLRKGLSFRDALAATLQTVMEFNFMVAGCNDGKT